MAMKLIIALTTVAVVAAVPLPGIRSARFCDSWAPYGTNFISDESPYEYFCSPSIDRRSLTMRVIARDPETAYTYMVMAAVDESGNALIEGEYKVDTRLRTQSCPDKSRRVIKVDEEKVRDIMATYRLPEDKETTLTNINCRFAIAINLESYYSDVIINTFGDQVEAQEMQEMQVQNETEMITEPRIEEPVMEPVVTAPRVEEPVIESEVAAPRVEEPIMEETNSTEDAAAFNSTEPIETTKEQEREVVAVQPVDSTTDEEEQIDTTEGDMENFVPTGTVDETDNLQQKFENEETVGHETKTEDKDTALTLTAPEVPEVKEEFKNEGQQETFEAEFITDEFGIKRQVIRENEKKLNYKGQLTGYWCESFGNTYVMAPGSDCKMFYQTVMPADSLEVVPLASFNCAPGTRFNANPGKCICVNYQAMVCPDASTTAEVKPASKPDTPAVLPGADSSSFNSTEVIEPFVEESPTQFNQTSQF